METPEVDLSTGKIKNILHNFENILNSIKLQQLSGELYELINVINIVKNMLQSESISRKNLEEIKNTINTHIEAFLSNINNNQEIKTLIDNNYFKPINELDFEKSKLNTSSDNIYKVKYLKYKQKYIQLKTNFTSV